MAAQQQAGLEATRHFDVLIIGAGLSGIGMAAHLQDRLPRKTFAILEGRADLGGTWDLFRYPGIRSDSDMYTLGYRFKPWTAAKAIADGPSIKAYIAETARERGLDHHIRYGHKVVRADWSSATARWTLQVDCGGSLQSFSTNFLVLGVGYYSYDQGHRPTWAGEETFAGSIVHPQFWPKDLDYKAKRVVVIGSGATAVTLVPTMAETAAHVTMLQRSPTYIVSRPSVDGIAEALKRRLPSRLAYGLTRWKNILMGQFFYKLARSRPQAVKRNLLDLVRKQVGSVANVERDFTPAYNPWDQRLCLVPDADMFRAIRDGRASVVTDTIERFTPGGIRLASGQELAADVVVTATGLKLNLMGDIALAVDGRPVEPARTMNYKGCMFSDVPNLVYVFGYTNASWTLKADLVSEFTCRLLAHMEAKATPIAVPERDPSVAELPFLDFASGYVQRAIAHLPRQGARRPWQLRQNYTFDLLALRLGRVADGTMAFRKAGPTPAGSAAPVRAAA
ncbi:flavin-containing monooxygenase [Zavarzinia sp. CC-PAN008]|uniref:flavin-containing monooxygenase n=1 Tax=Zavarzinia sp. CC-PAN008 TaxID=3243332 RepID=UPI003F74A656